MKKVLLSICVLALSASLNAQTEETYAAKEGVGCTHLWTQAPTEELAFLSSTNSRTACVHNGVVYVAYSNGGYSNEATAEIHKFDVVTGKYLGVLNVTNGGEALTGYYVANQIGVDNYGNLYIAKYMSSLKWGAYLYVINKETGAVTKSITLNQKDQNAFQLYHLDVVGDLTLKNDNCVIMAGACGTTVETRVARWDGQKGGSFSTYFTTVDADGKETSSITALMTSSAKSWGTHTQLKIALGKTDATKYDAERFYVDGQNTVLAAYNTKGEILNTYGKDIAPRGMCEFKINDYTLLAYTDTKDASSVSINKLDSEGNATELWSLKSLGTYGQYATSLSKDDSDENLAYFVNFVPLKGLSVYKFFYDKTTGVEEVGVDANAPVEYYNLQGVKVENPSNGIFIKKQGSRTSKVVL